jgi:hypothetical protein
MTPEYVQQVWAEVYTWLNSDEYTKQDWIEDILRLEVMGVESQQLAMVHDDDNEAVENYLEGKNEVGLYEMYVAIYDEEPAKGRGGKSSKIKRYMDNLDDWNKYDSKDGRKRLNGTKQAVWTRVNSLATDDEDTSEGPV